MKKFLDKIHIPLWLAIFLGVILILRIPSFFEPYYYGDEMIYLGVGEAIKKGLLLYKGIYDNKPTLLYLTAAIAGNLFWFKSILAFWNLITIFLFWKLVNLLFPTKEKLHKVAVIIFGLLTTLPLLEGNIANAELFLIGPTIAAFLLLYEIKNNYKRVFFAGLLFSIGVLFKIPAVFDVPIIVVYWLIETKLNKESLKEIALKTLSLGAGLILPILLTFIYFAFKGAFKEYLTSAFMQNVGYLSTFRPGDVQKSFLMRNLPLLVRGFIVIIGAIILYWKRNSLSKQFIFSVIWLLFALFATTLSERPYPHYLIQAAAPISILLAILFTEKSLEQSLVIIPLCLAFFVPVYYKYYYYSTSNYYLRFIKFVTKITDKNQYFSEFDRNLNRNYEIADFLVKSSKPDEKIFVNGDTPSVYALSRHLPYGKYLADYHINDFSSKEAEVDNMIKNKPSFIILLPEARPFPQLNPLLRNAYISIQNVSGAEIWRLIK